MLRTVFCGLALAAWSTAAVAQTSTPLDRERADREPSAPRPARPDAPGAAVRVDAGEAATPVDSIVFDGTDVPEVVAKAAEEFLGLPASRENLQALVDAMSRAYGRSDVALFTVIVPEQDLSTGELHVLVAEGHIETVALTGEVDDRPLQLVRLYAERLTKERPTSRRTLERYLSLIEDIPGLAVQSRLELGQASGAVRLVLVLDHARPSLRVSFNNRTSDAVRDGEVQATARAYGLLREGDETRLTLAAAVNLDDMRYLGLSHSTPIGVDGVRLALSAGDLETQPPGDRSGRARTLGATLSYPVIRSSRRDFVVSLSLDGVDSEDAAFGSVIATERARAARAAGAFAASGDRRKATVGLTLSQGLDVFGVDVAAPVGEAEFFKLNAAAGVDQALGARTTLRLRASQQWTDDPLPAVERFSIGGPALGRAFENGVVSADRGVGGLAELAWRPIGSGAFARSELYGFADAASVRLLPRPGFAGRDFDLSSAGVGVRAAWTRRVTLELELARPLERPFPDNESDWRVWVGWRISAPP